MLRCTFNLESCLKFNWNGIERLKLSLWLWPLYGYWFEYDYNCLTVYAERYFKRAAKVEGFWLS